MAGGARSQVNKSHKTRYASKSSRHAHRTASLSAKAKIGKSDGGHRAAVKGTRAARVQKSKAIRDQKRAALLKEKRSSVSAPPRVVVLFGLSSNANATSVKKDLLQLLSGDDGQPTSDTIASSAYRLRTTVLEAPYGDLVACMEMAKVADLIAFVVSANSLYDNGSDGLIDPIGAQCLSLLRAIGLSSTSVLIRDLPQDVKSKSEAKKISISSLSSEMSEDCKYYAADTKEELHKFMWLFKEQHLSSPHWRNQRPYIMSNEVCLKPENSILGTCTLVLSGYLRAHNLSPNQLVHVTGAGDFQLSKVDILKDPFPLNERRGHNLMESEDMTQICQTLIPDTSAQEPLLVENTPDPLAGEQTWPTEAEMAEADTNNKERKIRKRKLPRGTSDYQAAWIVEGTDSENDNSDIESEEGNGMVLDEELENNNDPEKDEDTTSRFTEKFDEETGADTEMEDDEHMTREQIEADIKRIKNANAEDEEFPDEVETPLDVPAKKRFAKYRSLKSFRTSPWDPKESLPVDYARIFAFDNFSRTQKHVLKTMREVDEGSSTTCAQVGSFVRIHVKNVPIHIASRVCHASKAIPVVTSGLLQHESKMSVLHFSVKKNDSYVAPIKSKETFIFNVGFRQFVARPLFSGDNINSDKHKLERFLHPGRFSVASVYAPICFPPLPLIVLKKRDGELPAVAATGSLKSVDPDRIILKKIILTGYPQRVSKLKATVRYMFHSPDDVRWFKPVDVWTKHGRHGRIKEPVGTHGAMKCVFNSVVQQHDTVCMSLYKRIYPRWPEQLYDVAL
ncbi:Pre-rRNA-processing protein TSR1 [Carex littledalei]|uniref:Pre-rRNA-processing protein TSR1 n=1 Tax=Carex littledalei TaxID=544730 RepID=A0A833RAV0_9POAL|nr:Pre-rRNA-processing protein TSR1 [Carex littledalei]